MVVNRPIVHRQASRAELAMHLLIIKDASHIRIRTLFLPMPYFFPLSRAGRDDTSRPPVGVSYFQAAAHQPHEPERRSVRTTMVRAQSGADEAKKEPCTNPAFADRGTCARPCLA
jgi:hypothetical protein